MREKLPYRKNCEAYVFFSKDKVVARDTGKGYVEFPGGGVDEGETPEEAIQREVVEETGAVVEELQKIGVIYFDWGLDWAKTEKQKERYNKYRGEEMHLFKAKAVKLCDPKGCSFSNEPGWKGDRVILVKKVIDIIKSQMPFSEEMEEYRNMQLMSLKNFMNN